MATLIKANGDESDFLIVNGRPLLKQLQTAVEGYIELVRLPSGRLMLVNEEGKLQGKRHNKIASELTHFRHVIVGNALILTDAEERMMTSEG
jgi:hypothetical protein